MAHITVNGVDLPGGQAVTVVIQPGQPDPAAAVAAAEQFVTALTGRVAIAATDWDDSTTVTPGRTAVEVAGGTPQLTPVQQLVEDQAAVYRTAAASEFVATYATPVCEKMRHALRSLIEAAHGLSARDARALVEQVPEDPRPVWAIVYERRGVPLDLLAMAS